MFGTGRLAALRRRLSGHADDPATSPAAADPAERVTSPPPPDRYAFEFCGQSFVLDADDGHDFVAGRMRDGVYEAPLPVLVMALVARTTGLFLDVGANNGLYSVLAAKARPGVRCVAFEPYPPALRVLRRNLDLNGIGERVTVHEIALSNAAGTASLFLPSDAHGLLETSASLEATFQPYVTTVEIRKARADDVDLGGPVSVIKADVEGHETAFLKGASATIAHDRPFIFAEMMSSAQPTFAECTWQMTAADYQMIRLQPRHAILAEAIFHDPDAWNWGLIPREKLPVFRDCCAAHGIELLQPA